MQLYYKAVNKKGVPISGQIEAANESEAAKYLRAHDVFPIKVYSEQQDLLAKYLPFYNHAGGKDVIFITRQLSSMLLSGLTLMQSLVILRDQMHSMYLSEVMTGIIAEVQDGHTFAQALSKYPKVFTPIYVSMIEAGEKSGLLDKVLTRLAINLEKSDALKAELRGAMIYPVIVVIIMIAVIGIMMVVVVPQLATLYKGLHVELPLMTQIVIAMSNAFVFGLPFIVVFGVVGIFLFRKWYKTASGKMLVDKGLLHIPLVGKLLRESTLVEFSRTFSLLIGTGSLVVKSLQQCADTTSNAFYRAAIVEVSKRVEKGVTIGDALQISNSFPPLLVAMVKIGEQTGKLDESLLRVSEYFEREVELTIKAVTAAIEPAILVILGVSVGFLIIAIITPIYGLVNAIK